MSSTCRETYDDVFRDRYGCWSGFVPGLRYGPAASREVGKPYDFCTIVRQLIFYWNRSPGLAIPLIALWTVAQKSSEHSKTSGASMVLGKTMQGCLMRGHRQKLFDPKVVWETERLANRQVGYGHNSDRYAAIRRVARYVRHGKAYASVPSQTARQPLGDDRRSICRLSWGKRQSIRFERCGKGMYSTTKSRLQYNSVLQTS